MSKENLNVSRLLEKYPDKVPIILSRGNGTNVPDLPKKKYLVPKDLTVAQFIYTIRKQVKLDPSQAIYLFFGKNNLPSASLTIGHVYELYRDTNDGALYGTYTSECTFG